MGTDRDHGAGTGNRPAGQPDRASAICPHCLSADVKLAAREQDAGALFVLRRPYVCSSCGVVFGGPESTVFCLSVAAAAAGFCILALAEDVIPAIWGWGHDPRWAGISRLLHIAVGGFAAAGFGCISYLAAKAVAYSRWYRRKVQWGTQSKGR